MILNIVYISVFTLYVVSVHQRIICYHFAAAKKVLFLEARPGVRLGYWKKLFLRLPYVNTKQGKACVLFSLIDNKKVIYISNTCTFAYVLCKSQRSNIADNLYFIYTTYLYNIQPFIHIALNFLHINFYKTLNMSKHKETRADCTVFWNCFYGTNHNLSPVRAAQEGRGAVPPCDILPSGLWP